LFLDYPYIIHKVYKEYNREVSTTFTNSKRLTLPYCVALYTLYTLGMNDLRAEVAVEKEAVMPQKRQKATYYTVTELAEALGVHRNTVIYWIDNSRIKAVKLGLSGKSPYYIEESEYQRVLSELRLS